MEIEKYLLKQGIQPHYKGFYQLAYAIELCQKNPKYLQGFTKWLYPDIAKDLGASVRQVERNMRDALKFCGIDKAVSKFIHLSILELKMQNIRG